MLKLEKTMNKNNKKEKNFFLSNTNYNKKNNDIQICLSEIKTYNFFSYLENFLGLIPIKKKSSKYGRYYKSQFGRLWVRYDYSTNIYFYINLDNPTDKGTLIDFIQNNILNEKNLGKVKKYFKDTILRQ